MSPIDFNPNNKPTDLTKQSTENKDRNQSVAKDGEIPAAPQKQDKFVRSEALQKFIDKEPTAQETQAREAKIKLLKQQVADKALPIMADNLEKRHEASRVIAEKLVEFEQQMAKLDE